MIDRTAPGTGHPPHGRHSVRRLPRLHCSLPTRTTTASKLNLCIQAPLRYGGVGGQTTPCALWRSPSGNPCKLVSTSIRTSLPHSIIKLLGLNINKRGLQVSHVQASPAHVQLCVQSAVNNSVLTGSINSVPAPPTLPKARLPRMSCNTYFCAVSAL